MKLALVTLALLLASCQTNLPPPKAGDSPEIYFQRANAAADLGEYDVALKYYQAFLDDNKDATHENQFSARYEIAMLLVKKGALATAADDFKAILADFDDLQKSSGVPGWIHILSQKKLQEIQDKLAKSSKPKT